MDIITQLFQKCHPVRNRLKAYGFQLRDGKYVYSRKFMDDAFEAIISIDRDGIISARVMELELNEEYPNVYNDSQYGAFVSKVREGYVDILNDILISCFEKDRFLSIQTKRIVAYLEKEYHSKPEFLWKKYPDYAVFRNRNTNKWYALIMNVDGTKIGRDKGEVEILNVKADKTMVDALLKTDGFHEAYHMNKEHWLSIRLDDTVDDEIIHALIDNSYEQMEEADEWLVPANPLYYDMEGCFDGSDTLMWKQSSDISVGDIVYLYVGKPVSAILYKCMATEVNIPYEYKDKNLSISRLMKLQLLKKYERDRYTYAYLCSLGIRFVRGPRRISKDISARLK